MVLVGLCSKYQAGIRAVTVTGYLRIGLNGLFSFGLVQKLIKLLTDPTIQPVLKRNRGVKPL
jgi:hypothetical protein